MEITPQGDVKGEIEQRNSEYGTASSKYIRDHMTKGCKFDT